MFAVEIDMPWVYPEVALPDAVPGAWPCRSRGRHRRVSTPQQPELHRSGRGASDPASAKSSPDNVSAEQESFGPVPPDNTPGHHPEHEQDKPAVVQE
jgi:hypothetical protein